MPDYTRSHTGAAPMTADAKPSSSPTLIVAVATYKRVSLLDNLLESLTHLTFTRNSKANVSIAIIDNDPDKSAEACVRKWIEDYPFHLEYFHEERPGVTHVRNRALDIAQGSDFLAFVDDDEFVTPEWLDILLSQIQTEEAAAVFGPVHPVYTQQAPDWISKWGVHGTYIDTNGLQKKPGATCNCLIDMSVVMKEAMKFDPKMSLTGGEDTLFFSQLQDKGYTLAQSSDAVVHEHIPDQRATVIWLLKRWYRTGITDALIGGRNSPSLITRTKALFGGIARIGIGGLLAGVTGLVTVGQNPVAVMKRLYTVSRGAGMVAFAFGHQYEEYGRKKTG